MNWKYEYCNGGDSYGFGWGILIRFLHSFRTNQMKRSWIFHTYFFHFFHFHYYYDGMEFGFFFLLVFPFFVCWLLCWSNSLELSGIWIAVSILIWRVPFPICIEIEINSKNQRPSNQNRRDKNRLLPSSSFLSGFSWYYSVCYHMAIRYGHPHSTSVIKNPTSLQSNSLRQRTIPACRSHL